MPRHSIVIYLNESDILTIIEALEMLQKDSLDALRNRYNEIKETDREYYVNRPAAIAKILHKMDLSWDALKKS